MDAADKSEWEEKARGDKQRFEEDIAAYNKAKKAAALAEAAGTDSEEEGPVIAASEAGDSR